MLPLPTTNKSVLGLIKAADDNEIDAIIAHGEKIARTNGLSLIDLAIAAAGLDHENIESHPEIARAKEKILGRLRKKLESQPDRAVVSAARTLVAIPTHGRPAVSAIKVALDQEACAALLKKLDAIA